MSIATGIVGLIVVILGACQVEYLPFWKAIGTMAAGISLVLMGLLL